MKKIRRDEGIDRYDGGARVVRDLSVSGQANAPIRIAGNTLVDEDIKADVLAHRSARRGAATGPGRRRITGRTLAGQRAGQGLVCLVYRPAKFAPETDEALHAIDQRFDVLLNIA